MKKILLLLVVIVAATSVSAQVYVGGNVGFWRDDDADYTNFRFEPEIGYNLDNQWALGINLGYLHSKGKYNLIGYEGTVKLNALMAAPYVRYTYLEAGIVRLFLDGGFGFTTWKVKGHDSENGFEIGIKPGIAIKLNDRISLTGKVGFVGYRDDYLYAADDSNGFGLSLAGEDLTVGISVNF
ncbi:MAG: porin family protein [Bacteroides sp.]|nr:porin family protein [Bacteroides sp.]